MIETLYVNKDSIRTKILEVKVKSKKTLESSDVSPEIASLIDSFLLIINILAMVFLEKRVRKTSSNSGVPPSQNFGSNGNRNKNIDNKNAHKGEQLPNTRNVEITEVVPVDRCNNCEADLSDKNPDDT